MGESVDVLVAAVTWYAEQSHRVGLPQGTLAISTRTSGRLLSRPDASDVALSSGEASRWEASGRIISQLRERSGVAVAVCDSLHESSLCGIPQPWTWVVLSAPAIDGDRAVVALQARWLEFGPDPAMDFSRAHVSYALHLDRLNGKWQVRSTTKIGEH
jgi:hypothetical protein